MRAFARLISYRLSPLDFFREIRTDLLVKHSKERLNGQSGKQKDYADCKIYGMEWIFLIFTESDHPSAYRLHSNPPIINRPYGTYASMGPYGLGRILNPC